MVLSSLVALATKLQNLVTFQRFELGYLELELQFLFAAFLAYLEHDLLALVRQQLAMQSKNQAAFELARH